MTALLLHFSHYHAPSPTKRKPPSDLCKRRLVLTFVLCINGIIQYGPFSAWKHLLNIMFMGFIILLCVVGDSLFSLLWSITLCKYSTICSVHSTVGIWVVSDLGRRNPNMDLPLNMPSPRSEGVVFVESGTVWSLTKKTSWRRVASILSLGGATPPPASQLPPRVEGPKREQQLEEYMVPIRRAAVRGTGFSPKQVRSVTQPWGKPVPLSGPSFSHLSHVWLFPLWTIILRIACHLNSWEQRPHVFSSVFLKLSAPVGAIGHWTRNVWQFIFLKKMQLLWVWRCT